jgi:predicted XRE-type DNA-binding protein
MGLSRRPSNRLTFDNAVEIWLRYWNGEFQNRIAALFDVNPGRVSDVVKGRKHRGSEQVARRRRSGD